MEKAARCLRAGPLAAAASRWRVRDGRGMAAECRGLIAYPRRWGRLSRKRCRVDRSQRCAATAGATATAVLGGFMISRYFLRSRRVGLWFGVVVCVFMRDARKVFGWRGDRCPLQVRCFAAAAQGRRNALHRQAEGQKQSDQQAKQRAHLKNIAWGLAPVPAPGYAPPRGRRPARSGQTATRPGSLPAQCGAPAAGWRGD